MRIFVLRNSVLRSSCVIPLARKGLASVHRIVEDTVFLFKGGKKPGRAWFTQEVFTYHCVVRCQPAASGYGGCNTKKGVSVWAETP